MGKLSLILARPNFEGLDSDPWFLFPLALGLLFVAAVVCVIAHDFRLTMKHPTLKRGRLYEVAVWVMCSVAVVWSSLWAVGHLLRL